MQYIYNEWYTIVKFEKKKNIRNVLFKMINLVNPSLFIPPDSLSVLSVLNLITMSINVLFLGLKNY